MIISDVTVTTTTTGSDDSPAEEFARIRPCLSIVHHADPKRLGVRGVLSEGRPLMLGRGQLALGAGVLGDRRMSRQHASVSWQGGGVRIRDEGSHNGTFVNGERVQEAVLQPGDVVGLGATLLLFHEAPAAYRVRHHARLVGVSHHMSELLEQIERVAPHKTTVLILGETGTGKELVAREIHDLSGRKGTFAAVNCGGVAEGVIQSELFGCVRGAFSGADRDRMGLIEACHGGTLFLDEVGDASPALQRALLRVLQEGATRRVGSTVATPVDTRFVAATHRDLPALVARGDFREDLYARLSGWVLRLPALRERREDIPHLVAHVTGHAGTPRPLHHTLALRLLRYGFPRNVRELEKIVERAAIECEGELRLTPGIEALLEAPPVSSDGPRPAPLSRRGRPEHDELRVMLEEHGGNVTKLAEVLGVGRNTLYRWLKAAEIDLRDHRSLR